MSFILDALKKLEREKQAREPGVVVVGPAPWGGVERRRRARTLGLAAAVLGAVAAGAVWWLDAGATPPPAPRVDRDAAAVEPVAAPAATEPSAAAARPPAAEATPARPATPRAQAATTSAAPLPAPAPRELDLPRAESATAASPSSEATASDDTPPAAPVETVPEQYADTAPADAPTEETPVSEPEFRLTAISTRDGEPIALLNDRLVREGDSFGGVRVIRIGVADIEIEVDGERRTIGF